MCGKERTYWRDFCKCGRERSYGILRLGREVGGMLEVVQKASRSPRTDRRIRKTNCQELLLTKWYRFERIVGNVPPVVVCHRRLRKPNLKDGHGNLLCPQARATGREGSAIRRNPEDLANLLWCLDVQRNPEKKWLCVRKSFSRREPVGRNLFCFDLHECLQDELELSGNGAKDGDKTAGVRGFRKKRRKACNLRRED